MVWVRDTGALPGLFIYCCGLAQQVVIFSHASYHTYDQSQMSTILMQVDKLIVQPGRKIFQNNISVS